MDESKLNDLDLMFFAAFAIVVLIFMTDGWRTRRKQNRRFAALARASGSPVVKVDEFEHYFVQTLRGRTLKVTEKLVSTGSGRSSSSSYKLITSTALHSKAWQLHFFRVRPRASIERWFVDKLKARLANKAPAFSVSNGDFASDFAIENTGAGLPDDWLDKSAQSAIRNFYNQPENIATLDLEALVAEQGQLEHRLSTPYKSLNADNLAELLVRLTDVAEAFDEAARSASQFH
jgi:hypothetical protein